LHLPFKLLSGKTPRTMIYTLLCTDTAASLHWQCELLEYSWSRYNQPGELIRLVSCKSGQALPEHRHARVYKTEFTNVDPVTGDHYPPYNRLYSIQEWLTREKPEGTVLIVDPDMIFRDSIKTEVNPGNPIGQHWLDFGMQERKKKVTREICSVDLAQIQPVTWPALIHTKDLARLMPRWIELTSKYRHLTGGWEDDMFAFAVASAELGIVYSFGNLSAWTPWPEEKVVGAPIVHFCQKVKDKNDEVIWSKNSYQPWDHVFNSNAASLDYCRDLLNIVNEHARIRQSAEVHKDQRVFVAIAAYCEPELVSTIESCISKALNPQNLRFGICLQYDNTGVEETAEACLDRYLSDNRVNFVKFDYRDSRGGCWARNLCQEFYRDEEYTLQVDAHSQFIEGWDAILMQMLDDLPSNKPLITSFPPLYTLEDDGKVCLSNLNNLNQIPTTFAKSWKKEGWLEQSHKFIPENNAFPRRTRLLSGAFVFTLGQWNEEVRQDPEHFYTGEEFALALRSYTHGYDLFDPNQIVVWHRLHPKANRKFWHDNKEATTNKRHENALSRLRTLLKGDPYKILGRYGPGSARTLDDFRIFSGLDCQNLTIHPDASNGVPPEPVTIPEEFIIDDDFVNDISIRELSETDLSNTVELTVRIEGIGPLQLECHGDAPILGLLFAGLIRNATEVDDKEDEVMYLELAENGTKTLYFFRSQILSIESVPPLSSEFFSNLCNEQPQIAPLKSTTTAFNDSWKFWIWDNVNRGSSKEELLAILLDKGFQIEDICLELGFDPGQLVENATRVQLNEAPDTRNYFIPNAVRINSDQIELYTVSEFLSESECGQMIELVKRSLVPSTTVSDQDNRAGRTSSTCFFKNNDENADLVDQIRTRLCKIMGINPDYAEALQGQFYLPGEEYKPHFDFFDPDADNYTELTSDEMGGQRTWSILLYLNEVEEGGGTHFTNIDQIIEPQPGKLIIWNNLLPSGQPNPGALHHAMPVVSGEKTVLTMWFRAVGSGELYSRVPAEEIPNHTKKGFKKVTLPRRLFHKINDFYHENSEDITDESIPEFLYNKDEGKKTSDLILLPRELKIEISNAVKSVMEEWSNLSLESTAVYGLRRYFRGATLKMHRDTSDTHIISAILNIEQDVDTNWPLEIEDNYYRTHKVNMQPGDMLLYEGARALHGRPRPLDGRVYCNVFVHFMPASGASETDDDIRV